MLDDEDPDEVVAAHEAGHVVAAFALGREVFSATIDPPADGRAGGAHTYGLPAELSNKRAYSATEVELIAEYVQKTIAGPLAESWAVPERSYEEALERNTSDARSDGGTIIGWGDRVFHADHPASNRWQDEQRQAIETVLRAHQKELDAVTAALLTRRTLTGAELRSIYEAASSA